MSLRIPTQLRVVRATALAVVLALVGSALVWAAIPDGGGTIHGCYTSNGTLRVVDSDLGQTCKSNEKALDWSATSSTAYQSVGSGHLPAPDRVVVADVSLPPGSYALTATVDIVNTGPADVLIACYLEAGGALVNLVHQTVGPSSATAATYAALVATGVADLSGGGVAQVACEDQLNSGSPTALQGRIIATSVAEVVVQIP